MTAFSIHLRTGRKVDGRPLEVKFNPWHDPENGRFTFVGQGNYFSRGSQQATDDFRARRGFGRGPWALETDAERGARESDPENPRNYAIHRVQPGDSLSSIARRRKRLRVSDLAWLNGLDPNKPLQIGQAIKLPHQHYLDAGRNAKNKAMALAYYMDTHGGRLPPNPANPPSVESQILDTNWRRESRNGYDYQIDVIARPRKVYGQLSLGPVAKRSRPNQAAAGRPNRRPTDDGGHFIAARFNGPSDSFNHFAQDANFNRGGYRAMENGWARDLAAGRKVFVVIEPRYAGASKRPFRIDVTWTVDGEKDRHTFPNEAKGKQDGKR